MNTMEKSIENSNTLIELKDVCKEYDGQTVVDHINLEIKKGEFVTFLGPSGCGKTTTLRMIAGFETPNSGEIILDGKSVLDIPPHLRPVNTVFQRYALFPHLNVFDNIAFGLKLRKKEMCTDIKSFWERRKAIKKLISDKVKRALKIVGLTDYEYRNVTSLSGGQQQRVAIARAIVNEPQVLLLDEPLGALDLKMRQEMQLELKNMHRRLGITFVYVTHDQEEALTMSDRIVVMKNGVIHQVGTPLDIYNEPNNAFVADFIGESNIINGVMIKDKLVRFAGQEFDCVDGGFEPNQPIDVVIRPEDIFLMDEDKGQIKGVVISSLFKGVHYEMSVVANKVEFLIHSTTEWKPGEKVSLFVRPDDIHIMKKEKNSNIINAKVLNESEIEFADGVFEYQPSIFEKAGYSADEYIKAEVKVSIDFDKIDLTDYENDAPIAGNIVSSIFKGDKWQYVVKSDNGFDFFVDTEDEYDSNDRVGISIKPEDIKFEKLIQAKE